MRGYTGRFSDMLVTGLNTAIVFGGVRVAEDLLLEADNEDPLREEEEGGVRLLDPDRRAEKGDSRDDDDLDDDGGVMGLVSDSYQVA